MARRGSTLIGAMLGGLAALTAFRLGNRRWQRRQTSQRSRSGRRRLERRAGQTLALVSRSSATWELDLHAALTAKLDELDRRRAEISNQADTDSSVKCSAAALESDYCEVEQLTRRVEAWATAQARPHPKIDELLAAREDAGVVTSARPDPPAPRHITRLANELKRLDSGRDEVLDLLNAAPTAGSPALFAIIDEQVTRYDNLSTAARRAWARMFPALAAEERAAGPRPRTSK